ncbi:hypothetical protein IAT38_007283 [Cryptococcus sp. DSM 104549]
MDRIRDGHFAKVFKERNMSLIIGEVEKEELLYAVTNPPTDLPALTVQLHNYYRTDQVAKIEKLYGVPTKCDPNDPEDRRKLREVYGRMVADGQVYVPERGLVNALFDHGVGMDRILRYRISWRPKGTDIIGLFDGEVSHSDDTWAWWYSKRYGMTESDCKVGQTWIEPVKAFYAGELDEAAKLWWGKEGIPTSRLRQRALKATSEITIIDDDRWDRCMKIAEEVKV